MFGFRALRPKSRTWNCPSALSSDSPKTLSDGRNRIRRHQQVKNINSISEVWPSQVLFDLGFQHACLFFFFFFFCWQDEDRCDVCTGDYKSCWCMSSRLGGLPHLTLSENTRRYRLSSHMFDSPHVVSPQAEIAAVPAVGGGTMEDAGLNSLRRGFVGDVWSFWRIRQWISTITDKRQL